MGGAGWLQVGFPAGLILDAVGPVVTTALAAVVEVAGLCMIALCDTDGAVHFYLPSSRAESASRSCDTYQDIQHVHASFDPVYGPATHRAGSVSGCFVAAASQTRPFRATGGAIAADPPDPDPES